MAISWPFVRCGAVRGNSLDRLLLIAAAALKFYGLGVSAMPRVGWFGQSWVQLAAAEWELVLGLWLLSGAFRMGSWIAAMSTFLTFAGVSGYFGFSGVASCGCLGAVQASPWWAFGIDVAALALLAVARPHDEPSTIRQPIQIGVKWAGGVVVLLCAVTLAASAVYGSPEAAMAWLRGHKLLTSDLDLGSGKPGDSLEAKATIRNLSDHPIRLVGGSADCSCTAIKDLPLTIEPGGEAEVGIQLTIPVNQRGWASRSVMRRTDEPSQSVVRFQVGCRAE